MNGPDPTRLALIVSTRQDESGKVKYEFGTGYFITSHLVLTASHAIPEDAAEVYARQESTGVRHKAEIAEMRVKPAWRDARLDAVVLKVTPGLGQAEAIEWMEALPEGDVSWSSIAYPVAASETVEEHTRFTTAGLKGTMYSQGGAGQGQRELELTVDAPARKEGWHGISGAPVFVGEKLAGIIKQVPNDFEGGRLRGLPTPTLLAVAAFREALETPWLSWPEDQRWMLVLRSARATGELESRAKAALKTFNAKYLPVTGGQAFQEEPVVAPIEEALKSPGRWLQLVKAMCTAPVMLTDVTQFQAGVMLALGVRAVVRRAVTLTTTADRYDETHLRQLPFNIQEAKLTSHGGKFSPKDPSNPVTVISQAIRDGLLEARLHSRYLDLPAYDAVRCPIPETAAGLQAARDSVLVLCSFQPEYSENWKAVSDSLLAYYAPKQPVRMLDLGSPRLVGQALFEYIRWAGTCIVDWTSWRPNVFFELGVRLACSNVGPICVIEASEGDASGEPQKEQLLELFRPVKYRCENPDATLRKEFSEHELRVSGKARSYPLTSLPHDATYQFATEYFHWQEDHSTALPQRILKASVEDNLGKDPQRAGVPPVLFSVNPAFAERVRTSMQERWVAAWYYLTRRFPNDLKTNGSLRIELKDLGENLLLWIPSDTSDTHLKKLIDEVLTYIDEYDSFGGGSGGNHIG